MFSLTYLDDRHAQRASSTAHPMEVLERCVVDQFSFFTRRRQLVKNSLPDLIYGNLSHLVAVYDAELTLLKLFRAYYELKRLSQEEEENEEEEEQKNGTYPYSKNVFVADSFLSVNILPIISEYECSPLELVQDCYMLVQIFQQTKIIQHRCTDARPVRPLGPRQWTCQTCFGEHQGDPAVGAKCATNHEYCQACVKTWIETKLGTADQEPRLFCLADSCMAEVRATSDGQWLPKPLRLAWERALATQSVSNAALDDLKICPKCKIFAIELDTAAVQGALKRLECMNFDCKHVSCLNCRAPYHGVGACDNATGGVSHTHLRVRVEECLARHRMRHCPGCSAPFLRQDGCNHMTCSTCGTHSCYLCLARTDGEYKHFHDERTTPGPEARTCPLRSNEQEVADVAFQNALREMKQWPIENVELICATLLALEPRRVEAIRHVFPHCDRRSRVSMYTPREKTKDNSIVVLLVALGVSITLTAVAAKFVRKPRV